MRKLKLSLLVAITLGVLSGCSALGPKPAEQILGQWQGSVGTFPLTVTFAAESVQLGSAAPISYELLGDRLTYENAGKQVRVVSFPDAASMQQLDPVTGTAHSFLRVE